MIKNARRLLREFRLTFVTAIALLAAAATHAHAADYYISGDGDDANPGTSQAHPWRTVARANRGSFRPGDRLLFHAGERFTGNLVLDAGDDAADWAYPLIVASYGRGRARLHAGTGTGVRIENLGGVVVKDLIVTGDGRGANRGSGIKFVNTLPGSVKLRFVRVENIEASGFGREGIFVGGEARDKSKSGFRDVQITNAVAHKNVYYGINVAGVWDEKATTYANEQVRVAHCRAYDNSGDPTYLKNHSGSGIILDDVNGGVIEHSVAYNNGFLCHNKGGGPVGIWAHSSNDITIQFCASYHNRTGRGLDGGGFDFDGGVTNSLMQYNYSAYNDGPGYLLYAYRGAPHTFANNVVRYNISDSDARKNRYSAFYVVNDGSGVRNLDIYQNTVIMRPSPSGSPKAIIVNRTENVRFRNNLLVSTGGVPLLEIGGDQPGLKFQGNNYWTSGAAFLIRQDTRAYDSLAAWRAATGQETNGADATGFNIEPRMEQRASAGRTTINHHIRSTLRRYKLRPDSPLIDAGLDLPRLFGTDMGAYDLWGTALPQGSQLDIGVHEFKSLNRRLRFRSGSSHNEITTGVN